MSDHKVTITVSGKVGSGKSALCGEIEILCKAIGVPVEWVGGQQDKNRTHADWTEALEMYKPTVTIVENIERSPAPQPDSVPQDSGERQIQWNAYQKWKYAFKGPIYFRHIEQWIEEFGFHAWQAAIAQKAVPIAVADRPTPEPLTSNDFAVVRRSIGPTPPAPIASTMPNLDGDWSPVSETLVHRLRDPIPAQALADMPDRMAEAINVISNEAADAVESLTGQCRELEYLMECSANAAEVAKLNPIYDMDRIEHIIWAMFGLRDKARTCAKQILANGIGNPAAPIASAGKMSKPVATVRVTHKG